MKRCGVCLAMYRGKGTRVLALAPDPIRVMACGACMKRTAPVLVAGIATHCRDCSSVAMICAPCARREDKLSRARYLAGALKVIDARRRAYLRAPQAGEQGEHAAGIVEGLRLAFDLIRKGDFPDSVAEAEEWISSQ